MVIRATGKHMNVVALALWADVVGWAIAGRQQFAKEVRIILTSIQLLCSKLEYF